MEYKIFTISLFMGIVAFIIINTSSCSKHEVKCVNGYLYQQVNKDSQIYTKVEYLNHYTQCVN